MRVLGLRFSTKKIWVAFVEGTADSPELINTKTLTIPKGFEGPDALGWLYLELTDLTKAFKPDCIVLKGTEPMAKKSQSTVTRIDNEAIALLVSKHLGICCPGRKVNSTLAKAVAGKGKAKYLKDLEIKSIPNFQDFSDEHREAILAALSELS
jgi:hypothetical protein